jgi:SAM-dependent methyltransferase
MEKEDFISINKKGWDELVKSNKPFSNTSLPEYGPFMENEEKLNLFKDVKGRKVLELGCAEGKSLEYLSSKGALELWGLDISEEQINKAKLNQNINAPRYFISPMEVNPGIPEEYFDYVLSLYSIGFSSDPIESLKLVSKYLKSSGQLILCWTHPFFNCLEIEGKKLIIGRSYNDEECHAITKGPDKVEMMQYNLKISTLVNVIIANGLVIDKIIEENPIEENHIGDYKSKFWNIRKIKACPTTLIIVAHKK